MADSPFEKINHDAPVRYEMDADEIVDIFVSGHYLTSFHKADITDEVYFQLFGTVVECTNCDWYGIESNVTLNPESFCPKCGCIAESMKKQE